MEEGGARGPVTCTTAVNGDNDDDDDASERHRKCIRANGSEQARGQNACENAYITAPSERREARKRKRKRERDREREGIISGYNEKWNSTRNGIYSYEYET